MWVCHKPELHGRISDLTKGFRSTVDAKGNFVASNLAETEEKDVIFEGMFHEAMLQFEETKSEDSEPELVGEEVEVSINEFLLEYFADEH